VDIVDDTRRFLVIVCICMFVSSTTVSSVFSAVKHRCASSTPPPVSGTLAQPEATAHVVFLNEVLSNPGSIWNCSEAGTQSAVNEAWVELYNPQQQALDLYTVHSSLDSGPNTTPFYFPVDAAIAAHGFLVVFPPVSIFAQLTSAAGSSSLRLLINSTLVDQVTLTPLVSDTSYARMPDGGDTWQVANIPTIDASNVLLSPSPTPKPTHTPKQLSSVKMNSKQSSTQKSRGTLDNGAVSDTSNQPVGIQPTHFSWNTLSVPATISPISATATQSAISHSVPQATDTGDLARKALLTSLAAALLLGLFWCSRFVTRKLSENPSEVPSQERSQEPHG
jgi:hypothetical protein